MHNRGLARQALRYRGPFFEELMYGVDGPLPELDGLSEVQLRRLIQPGLLHYGDDRQVASLMMRWQDSDVRYFFAARRLLFRALERERARERQDELERARRQSASEQAAEMIPVLWGQHRAGELLGRYASVARIQSDIDAISGREQWASRDPEKGPLKRQGDFLEEILSIYRDSFSPSDGAVASEGGGEVALSGGQSSSRIVVRDRPADQVQSAFLVVLEHMARSKEPIELQLNHNIVSIPPEYVDRVSGCTLQSVHVNESEFANLLRALHDGMETLTVSELTFSVPEHRQAFLGRVSAMRGLREFTRDGTTMQSVWLDELRAWVATEPLPISGFSPAELSRLAIYQENINTILRCLGDDAHRPLQRAVHDRMVRQLSVWLGSSADQLADYRRFQALYAEAHRLALSSVPEEIERGSARRYLHIVSELLSERRIPAAEMEQLSHERIVRAMLSGEEHPGLSTAIVRYLPQTLPTVSRAEPKVQDGFLPDHQAMRLCARWVEIAGRDAGRLPIPVRIIGAAGVLLAHQAQLTAMRSAAGREVLVDRIEEHIRINAVCRAALFSLEDVFEQVHRLDRGAQYLVIDLSEAFLERFNGDPATSLNPEIVEQFPGVCIDQSALIHMYQWLTPVSADFEAELKLRIKRNQLFEVLRRFRGLLQGYQFDRLRRNARETVYDTLARALMETNSLVAIIERIKRLLSGAVYRGSLIPVGGPRGTMRKVPALQEVVEALDQIMDQESAFLPEPATAGAVEASVEEGPGELAEESEEEVEVEDVGPVLPGMTSGPVAVVSYDPVPSAPIHPPAAVVFAPTPSAPAAPSTPARGAPGGGEGVEAEGLPYGWDHLPAVPTGPVEPLAVAPPEPAAGVRAVQRRVSGERSPDGTGSRVRTLDLGI